MGQRISVCVRKRPLTHREGRRGEADVVATPTGECVVVHEKKETVELTQYILKVELIAHKWLVIHYNCQYS